MMKSITHRFAAGALLWLAGCATIVGIEEHTFDAPSPACVEYCNKVEEACKGTHSQYSTRAACLGTCAKLPPGEDLEPEPNTVACRKKEAQRAIDTKEPQAHCPAAGPVGAPTCGSPCDSWCTLLQKTCPTEYSKLPNCQQACSTLKDRETFNLDVDHDGDTIQCRVEHVANASSSASAAATHCGHATVVATQYCRAPQDGPPDCAEFCRFNLAGCSGDLAVYESVQQCMAVCMALDKGTNGDSDQNTMGCRSYHTFNSILVSVSHCAHTGPGGDGHCGKDETGKTGNCVSYCTLAEKACGAAFAAKYSSPTACQLDCSTQPDAFGAKIDSYYRLATAMSGNTLQCRLLHASRALTDATACPSALGEGACQ
jgi:hypothetical protein